jgi:hypothetical protein
MHCGENRCCSRSHGQNGKLDRATVDAALDRILATMKSVNDELDELLAKARG